MYIYDTYMYIHIHMQELCLFANIYVWWRPLEGLEASPLHHPKELPLVSVGRAVVQPRIIFAILYINNWHRRCMKNRGYFQWLQK